MSCHMGGVLGASITITRDAVVGTNYCTNSHSNNDDYILYTDKNYNT